MSVSVINDSTDADNNCNLKWPHLKQFFEQHGKNEDKNIEFKCLLCKPKHKKLSTSNTSYSNLRAHIKSTHISMLDKFNAMIKKRSLNEDEPSTLKQLNLHEFKKTKIKLSQATFDRANMELIINTVSPFSFIEHPAFLKYSNTVAQMVPVSRRTLMRNINSNFEEMKNSIIKNFNDLKYVCVTADCWTAFRRSYVGFTAHWIDPTTFERKSNAIACRHIIGHHTYEILADMIELVLSEYKINTKVTHMVTDNASNFAKAFRLYSPTEDETETPENDLLIHSTDIYEILTEGEERYFRLPKQLRCASHTFNLLATNDVNKLEVKDGPYKTLSRRAFGKCRALFNKQNMSTVMADKIKNHLGRYLITPNDTRWNALYDSLSFIVSKFDEVENICIDLQLPCLIQPQETDFLTEYCKVMKPIAKALDILQGEKYISIGYLLPTLTAVKKSLNQLLLHGNLKYCKPLVEVLISGLKKRFDTNFEFSELKLAAVLEPKFKWNWAEVEIVNELKDSLKARLSELITQNSQNINNDDHTNEVVTDDDFLHFDSIQNPETDELQNIFNEYANSVPKLPLTAFSKEIQQLYLRYNTSIPSSAHVERLFSAGGQLFDERRGPMSDENFEMALLLKFNKYLE